MTPSKWTHTGWTCGTEGWYVPGPFEYFRRGCTADSLEPWSWAEMVLKEPYPPGDFTPPACDGLGDRCEAMTRAAGTNTP